VFESFLNKCCLSLVSFSMCLFFGNICRLFFLLGLFFLLYPFNLSFLFSLFLHCFLLFFCFILNLSWGLKGRIKCFVHRDCRNSHDVCEDSYGSCFSVPQVVRGSDSIPSTCHLFERFKIIGKISYKISIRLLHVNVTFIIGIFCSGFNTLHSVSFVSIP
jgi:hypothetical protein